MTKAELTRMLEPFTEDIEIFVRIGPDIFPVKKGGYTLADGNGEFHLNAVRDDGDRNV